MFVVEPMLYKPWLSKPSVKYAVFQLSQVWEDWSYGNGGGEYVSQKKLIHTYETKAEADEIVEELNNVGN